MPFIPLGPIGDRGYARSGNAIFGVIPEQVNVLRKVVLFSRHSIQQFQRSFYIVDGAVSVLALQTIGFNGVAQLVRIIMPVFIHSHGVKQFDTLQDVCLF